MDTLWNTVLKGALMDEKIGQDRRLYDVGHGGGLQTAPRPASHLRGRNLTDEVYTQSTSNTAGRIEPPRSVELTYAMSF